MATRFFIRCRHCLPAPSVAALALVALRCLLAVSLFGFKIVASPFLRVMGFCVFVLKLVCLTFVLFICRFYLLLLPFVLGLLPGFVFELLSLCVSPRPMSVAYLFRLRDPCGLQQCDLSTASGVFILVA